MNKRRSRGEDSRSGGTMNALVTLTMIVLNVIKAVGDCPRSCECKWKSGKESVLCVNASMTEIPKQLDSGTQVLVLSGNRLQKIGADEFFNASLLNLQKIFLSRCKLRIIDRCSFRKIINLVELDLSYNDLHSVPSHTFEFIKELRELRLNGNPIVRLLNHAFRMVPRLTKLDLSECRIAYVEIKAFQGLENSLELLKLDKNKIANVKSQVFVNLANLHGLELSGNYWNCSCGLRTLREWMLRQNVPGVPPTCWHPPRLSGKKWDKLELDEFACPPRIEAVSARKSGEEGSNVTMSCSIDGIPEPNVRWLRRNHAIANSSGAGGGGRKKLYVVRMAKQTSNLTIMAADVQDNGVYVCRAENKAGKSEANVTLAVTAKLAPKVWSPRVVIAIGAVSFLFATAVGLLTCCAWSLRKRKSYVRHAATGRQQADGYEMKLKNPIGYNKIRDYGNHCASEAVDNPRGVADRIPENEELRNRTAEVTDRGKPDAGSPYVGRRSGTADALGWSLSRPSAERPRPSGEGRRGPPPDPRLSGPNGQETGADSPRPLEGLFRTEPPGEDLEGENSAFFTPALPEKDKKFPDLLELSRNEENLINNNPFGTAPRKRSCKTRRGRLDSFGSESRSPLLPESGGDGWEGHCTHDGRGAFGRNTSLPPSPGALSQTPILDILEGSSESPTALKCKSWELEKFLKEYRNLQDQLYKMKESCEHLKEDNLKFREAEMLSNAVESATISKLIPPVYLEDTFDARFQDDADGFTSLYGEADVLQEDNNNTTSITKTNSGPQQAPGNSEACWATSTDFFKSFPSSRNSYFQS